MNRTSLLLAAAIIGTAGCDNMPWSKKREDAKRDSGAMKSEGGIPLNQMKGKPAVANIRPSRNATTQPANNNVSGTVAFTPTADGVHVAVNLSGLAPNSTHGFHIHEKGDLSDPGLVSAGGHFNPEGHKHAGPQSPMAHAGDLGNITADANGNVKTETNVRGLTLDNGPMGILGRSVLVHASPDDMKTDPTGNAGGRLAGGVIEPK